MLVRDIDRLLDMRMVLKVKQNTEFFNALSELKTKFPAFIYGKDQETWMTTYIPKDLKIQKMDIALRRFNASELESSYVIDSRINNVKDLSIIGKLMALPSFIINRSDISGGFINIYARFHSSQMDDVSELLAEYTSDTQNSRVDWLGPSPGIMAIMDMINSEYPLSMITYQIPIGEEEGNILGLFPGDVIAEVSNSTGSDGAFRSVLYSKAPVEEKTGRITPISLKSNIYMLEMKSRFFSMVREAANSAHIMRVRFFIKPSGDRLEASVFLPTLNIFEYYTTLFNIARENGNKIGVKHILPYTQDLWNFI